MEKLDSIERLKILRTGQTLPCPKYSGRFGAVGDPKTTPIFSCDKCGTSMVFTIKHKKEK